MELQECSIWLGLCYVVASLAIYDEYSNDILDMREGSCFPRYLLFFFSDLRSNLMEMWIPYMLTELSVHQAKLQETKGRAVKDFLSCHFYFQACSY